MITKLFRQSATFYFGFILIITAFLTIVYSKVKIDDAFIYYSYARNIITGKGFVFNPGERVNAATSPLYTLLLSLVSFIFKGVGISIPAAGQILWGAFLFFTAVILFKLFDKETYYPLQFFVPLLYVLNPILRNCAGMEYPMVIFLVCCSFYYYTQEKIPLTALFSALAILTRPDTIILILPAALILLFRKKIKQLALLIGLTLLFISPWYIFSWFYFHELLPSSVKVKVIQQSTGYWGTGPVFLKGFFNTFSGGYIPALIFTILVLISLIISLRRKAKLFKEPLLIMFIIWCTVYFILYTIMNPPPYAWYYTPAAVVGAILIGLGIKSIMPLNINLLMGMIIVIGLIVPAKSITMNYPEKYLLYRRTAEYINARSADPVVAIDEIGILRFYLNNGKVRDILGLSNPEAVRFIKKRDLAGFINYYKPDFIITETNIRPSYMAYTRSTAFNSFYKKETSIPGTTQSIDVYSRK